MSPTTRWYPVLKRYIGYVSARVDGLGGNSAEIQPSLQGVPVKDAVKGKHEYTGKICEVLYDCFGDFEGFVLTACCTERHVFKSREVAIGTIALLACEKRLSVSVWLDSTSKPERICKIIIRC